MNDDMRKFLGLIFSLLLFCLIFAVLDWVGGDSVDFVGNLLKAACAACGIYVFQKLRSVHDRINR